MPNHSSTDCLSSPDSTERVLKFRVNIAKSNPLPAKRVIYYHAKSKLNSFSPSADKEENKKLSELSLETAITLIPNFNRVVDEVYLFIEVCEFAISEVKEASVPILVRAIRTKLCGKVFKGVQNRRISNWVELKSLLKFEF